MLGYDKWHWQTEDGERWPINDEDRAWPRKRCVPVVPKERVPIPKPKPRRDPLRDALVDIAYDTATIGDAQKRAREALRDG